MDKMTIPAFILFLLFTSIIPPVKIIESDPEKAPIHDTTIIYKSVYDWQLCKRYEIKNEQVVRNMDIVANKILTPIQNFADRYRGKPTRINVISFCRDWKRGSEHTEGKAMDLDLDVMYKDFGNKEIFEFVKNNLVFNQLIIYTSVKKPTHIHISYDVGNNKQEVLLARKNRYRKTYYKRLN